MPEREIAINYQAASRVLLRPPKNFLWVWGPLLLRLKADSAAARDRVKSIVSVAKWTGPRNPRQAHLVRIPAPHDLLAGEAVGRFLNLICATESAGSAPGGCRGD